MTVKEITYRYMKSPIGSILLARNDAGLTHISFQNGRRAIQPADWWRHSDESLAEAAGQLEAYFHGEREAFDLPLAPQGTPFQLRVWEALLTIPCAETVSYGHIARLIGDANAGRAVGAANGRNPLPIVVPCHRVIGSNGKLVGYGGGLSVKEALLEHERRHYGRTEEQLTL